MDVISCQNLDMPLGRTGRHRKPDLGSGGSPANSSSTRDNKLHLPPLPLDPDPPATQMTSSDNIIQNNESLSSPYFTAKEAVKYLRLETHKYPFRALYRFVALGLLKSFTPVKKVHLFTKQQLDDFVRMRGGK